MHWKIHDLGRMSSDSNRAVAQYDLNYMVIRTH